MLLHLWNEMEPSSETDKSTSRASTSRSRKRRKSSSLWDCFQETVYQNGAAHRCLVCLKIYLISSSNNTPFFLRVAMLNYIAAERKENHNSRLNLKFWQTRMDKTHAPCTRHRLKSYFLNGCNAQKKFYVQLNLKICKAVERLGSFLPSSVAKG